MKNLICALSLVYALSSPGVAQSIPTPEPIVSMPPIRVACVGDSITFGYGVGDGARYPQVLNRLLGSGYNVQNFGSNGATLLKKGDQPYWTRKEFADALASKPAIVVIMLGTNDGRPANYNAHPNELAPDLLEMVGQFQALPTKPQIFIAPPVPAFEKGGFGIVPETIQLKILPLIRQTAQSANLSLIDTNTILQGDMAFFRQFYIDSVHPGDKGAAVIASAVARAILGRVDDEAADFIPAAAGQKLATGLTDGANNVDARDYEWPPRVPTATLQDGPNVAALVRLRRDNGNLCVFAEVFDETPLAGSNPEWGRADGVEILLGSLDNKKTARLFLSAKRGEAGELTGLAALHNPKLGAKAKAEIAGAKISARERFDKKGYFLEAEIPLAALPELTRRDAEPTDLLPVRFNAALWRDAPNNAPAQRLAWQSDGKDPNKLNPAAWRATGYRIPIQLSLAFAKVAPLALRYETTRNATFGEGAGPFLRVESPLIGGGWVQKEALEFAVTPFFTGFSIRAGPGGGTSDVGNLRTPKLQIAAANIDFTRSRAMHALDASQPVGITLGLNFPDHHRGRLHVLWGSYTANSNGGAVLKISDKTSGEVLDGAKHPAMTYTTGYNVAAEARETIVEVGGKRELLIEVQDNFFKRRAFLQGVWLETASPTEVSVGEPIQCAAHVVEGVPVKGVEFFANGKKIGVATQIPFVLSWKPNKPGTYQLTAQVTDKIGATTTSEKKQIRVR